MPHNRAGLQAPRVLMLCYYYPPISAAGTHRSVRFAKGLRSIGWEPIILTVVQSRTPWEHSGELNVFGVRTERSHEWNLLGFTLLLTGALNRLCDLLRIRRRPLLLYNLLVPDPQIAWLSTWRGARLARNCDCVYVSCSPFSSALSGCLIKLLARKPLILDFRDAWSLNPHSNESRVRRWLIAKLERVAVSICDTLILNTAGAERLYKERYPAYSHKFTCIPNGFDWFTGQAPAATSGKFTIMHVGDFYRSRTPDRLLDALANIRDPRVEFVQVGPMFQSYERYREKLSIRVIDRVPHRQALELMGTASLLYLAQGFEHGVTEYIAVASKTYEYLATGIPILADCPPGDNADLIRRYGPNSYVITTASAGEIEVAVREALARPRGATTTPNPEFLQSFNGETLTARLALVLANAARLSEGVPGPAPSESGRAVV